MAPPASAPLQDRVLALVKTLQFAWFAGHLLTLFGTLAYIVTVALFRANTYFYKIAYFGALTSYGVVIYKTHGKPQPNLATVQKLVLDENVQYLVLAVLWFLTSPIAVTLIPFFTFSTFHALGYVRTNIIPNVFPRPVAATTSDAAAPVAWQTKTQQQIKSLTDKYYGLAMRFVAQSEVTVIGVRLLFGLFSLRIIPVFVFVQFLRFRYYLSTYTRQTFAEIRVKADSFFLPPTADPRLPAIVPKVYVQLKNGITKFGTSMFQQQPAPAAAQ